MEIIRDEKEKNGRDILLDMICEGGSLDLESFLKLLGKTKEALLDQAVEKKKDEEFEELNVIMNDVNLLDESMSNIRESISLCTQPQN